MLVKRGVLEELSDAKSPVNLWNLFMISEMPAVVHSIKPSPEGINSRRLLPVLDSEKAIPFFLIAITFLLRLFFCTRAPDDSSDLFRHLGFTSHFFENPSLFYQLKAGQFPTEFWSQFWSEQGYIYPPAALLFFSLFGTLGIGLFWVKLSLTLCDLASGILIGRASSWWAAVLVFSAPVSVWYTSHEGQYESLVSLLVIITILSVRSGRWIAAGAVFMLALQTKQLAILLTPYLVFEILHCRQPNRLLAGKGFIIGFVAAFLPFIPFYYWRPDLWFLPLQSQANLLNPFYWPLGTSMTAMAHFDGCSYLRILWDAIVSIGSLAVLALFLAGAKRGEFRARLLQALPVISFWLLIKSMAWVMSWYMIVLSGLTFALWRYRKWMILLFAFYWLQCGQQVSRCIGDDDHEDDESVAFFHQSLWHGDYRAQGPDLP
jgi:hypothetical protein